MKLFNRLKEYIHGNTNNNFHFDNLDWTTQVWIKSLCEILNKKPKIKFEKMYDNVVAIPKFMTDGSAGMDISAYVKNDIESIFKDEIKVFHTGLKIAIPKGYEAQIRSRSGLSIKHGITVINSPGTIDSDYRGEIKVGLINKGTKTYQIEHGDRIAQLVIKKVEKPKIEVVDKLDETKRNENGFGSTGRK